MAEGKIDILIGTHKLLQSDVKFKDLGLLIVDEEHRFGVRHKERIKAMRANVDILTLTATPIPRTLNMAMSGMRDLSIIATPPARRLAVKTFVREYDSLVVREAILREILRGGQVYYLYNDVENIQKAAERLAELVPEARIAIGHGQMRERELERVMTMISIINVSTCWFVPPLSKPGSTFLPPTPLSLNARITSVWHSCTSCAVASGVRTTRHMHGC
ncbi:hypothetical protein EIMP300_60880 [Escherichia coli]|uniref:Helicase ATP-binding domain-containing protein n=1 Tax=Escherichia coli TaxID=562 RepID=A0A8S0FY77_ECOLX|nr:hypothetical protein EIMP300_60880 [Escherichia coli]